ncbi:MAG: RluA family pseudouridine synthase, partial [Propionibacteriaceae bacterium]|nr:RluA family pseudouridine synthase [Propionibacteriaceae bacterium]
MTVALVPDGLDGERVDAAASRMTGLSRSQIERLIAEGGVLVGGTPVAKSHRVRAGDLVEVAISPPERTAAPVPRLAEGLRIVYDDPDIVVVDKPPWVAAHPSLGWTGPSVTEHLAAAGFQITTAGAAERQGVVQRLDVGTSGLMVVAKSERAYASLKRAFRERTVKKLYHALDQGYPDPLSGVIDAPIGHSKGPEWKMAVTAAGRPSVTHYDTLEVFTAASLLAVRLETGRTHQIRVHLAAVHHPCAGDLLYGADPVLAGRLGLARQWLHAVELAFTHPGSGEAVSF